MTTPLAATLRENSDPGTDIAVASNPDLDVKYTPEVISRGSAKAVSQE